MNINNGNYEEYFLLYADNELTAAQRRIVEMFVKANPHLKKEWDELMATIQEPDEILFTDKSFLMKRPVDDFIDMYNYEKRFVEYHDGALTEQEKGFVQNFLSEHPGRRSEFDLIGRSYLAADETIVFPDKTALYRKSAVVRYGLFIRIAAAAVFIGFMIWFGARWMQEPHSQRNIVEHVPSVKIPETISPKQQPAVQPSPLVADKPAEPSKKKNVMTEYATSTIPESGSSKPSGEPKEEGIVPREQTAIIAGIPGSDNDMIPEISETAMVPDVAQTIVHNDVDVTPVKELPQSYTASFSQEPEENNFVFTDIPAENLQRSKLGVFIKKVKRTIDRNNPINRIFNAEED